MLFKYDLYISLVDFSSSVYSLYINVFNFSFLVLFFSLCIPFLSHHIYAYDCNIAWMRTFLHQKMKRIGQVEKTFHKRYQSYLIACKSVFKSFPPFQLPLPAPLSKHIVPSLFLTIRAIS